MTKRRQSGAPILIVERNPPFARLLRSELLNRGFRNIRLAFGAADALALLTKERFAVVICDADSPGFGGAAFVRAARAGEDMVDPFVPIIVTSFAPTLRVIADCRDAGANMFLAKPVSNDQLTEKLLICLTETRSFVKVRSYFGPDRRKGERPRYRGPQRRGEVSLERVGLRTQRSFAR